MSEFLTLELLLSKEHESNFQRTAGGLVLAKTYSVVGVDGLPGRDLIMAAHWRYTQQERREHLRLPRPAAERAYDEMRTRTGSDRNGIQVLGYIAGRYKRADGRDSRKYPPRDPSSERDLVYSFLPSTLYAVIGRPDRRAAYLFYTLEDENLALTSVGGSAGLGMTVLPTVKMAATGGYVIPATSLSWKK